MIRTLSIVVAIALGTGRVTGAQPSSTGPAATAGAPIGPLAGAAKSEHEGVALGPKSTSGDDDVEWSRLQRIGPGRDIQVILSSPPTAGRTYVSLSADHDGLTVLNLNLLDPAPPKKLAATLREIARRHPDYFARARGGGTVVVGDVRLASTGIFVGDRQVADLDRTLTTIPRRDVAQIRLRERGRGFWGHLGPLGGYFLGGVVGGTAAARVCRCDAGHLTGALFGGIAGGLYGFAASHHETERTLYARRES